MKRTRLIARRDELHMTQEQVAHAVGIDRSTYVRYETGLRTPSLDVARRIAALLHSTVDHLFGSDVATRNTVCDGHPATLDPTGTG